MLPVVQWLTLRRQWGMNVIDVPEKVASLMRNEACDLCQTSLQLAELVRSARPQSPQALLLEGHRVHVGSAAMPLPAPHDPKPGLVHPRRTVGPLGAPSTGARCTSTAKCSCPPPPARSQPPSTPARCPGPERAMSRLPQRPLSYRVSPAWSAAFRSRTARHIQTSPAPSAATFRAWSHRYAAWRNSAPVPGFTWCGNP
jgi:hypothetical protein